MEQKRYIIGMCCAVMMWASACVTTSDGEQMRTDIEALKAEQETMQKTISERETVMAEMIAAARKENALLRESIARAQETLQKNNAAQGIDLQQMREELDKLRGQAEESDFRLAKMEQDMQLFKEDVELRLQGVTEALALPENATELFELGQTKLAEKSWRDARKICEAFVNRHPEDTRVPDAIYCMGETFYNEGQHVSAVYEYQKIIKHHYDTSKRTPDAALRIGQSFKALNKCNAAQPFFEIVVSDYKRSAAAKVAKKEIDAGCPK